MNSHIEKYPTSLQEDVAILKKDEEEPILTNNERNCILFRKGEKVILRFLKEIAILVPKLAVMS